MATSVKQATWVKQAWILFPKKANILKYTCTCIKQAPVFKQAEFDYPSGAYLYRLGCILNLFLPNANAITTLMNSFQIQESQLPLIKSKWWQTLERKF